ncbi:Receptor-like kinase [Quillaja saponaria]|uniref:non-specific serine/threonine protein kinase n=1 Tax=Quillaja saponaria TaxID=32244 RepID=A0AAD7PA76_QUISA|nr:Receptor-like kinase [Quillaja saponaria]
MVYEYLEEDSLDKILKSIEKVIALDWDRRIHIVKGVANALYYMHHNCSPSIIHRDISSKNILLELAYTMDVNGKCDVYSYGVLTLEMVLGQHPGDLISLFSLSSSSMRSTLKNLLLKDDLDQRLSLQIYPITEEIISVAKLDLACWNKTPHSRPSMEQVFLLLAINSPISISIKSRRNNFLSSYYEGSLLYSSLCGCPTREKEGGKLIFGSGQQGKESKLPSISNTSLA